jgi:hypothetical protein
MSPSEIAKHITADLLRVSHDVLIRDIMIRYGIGKTKAMAAIDLAIRRG